MSTGLIPGSRVRDCKPLTLAAATTAAARLLVALLCWLEVVNSVTYNQHSKQLLVHSFTTQVNTELMHSGSYLVNLNTAYTGLFRA